MQSYTQATESSAFIQVEVIDPQGHKISKKPRKARVLRPGKISPVKLDADGKVIPAKSKTRVATWMVSFGKRYTGSERERLFFPTEREANEEIQRRLKLRQKEGDDSTSISAALRAEAVKCAQRLPDGVTLTMAVDYYLARALPPGGHKTFREVMELFLRDRENNRKCRPKTLKGYESFSRVLNEQWGDENIREMSQVDIEDWLEESPYQSRTRINYLMTLSTVFNFAKKKKFCLDNPTSNVSRPILDDKPVGILTPAQARQLLAVATVYLPEITDGLAIGLFAGLRVSELCALDWSEINLSERLIEVTAAKSKTRKRRLVRIADNLAQWLAPRVQAAGPVLYRMTDEGTREVLGANRFNKDLRWLVAGDELEERPGVVSPWPHNAIRHSFGTYYFGKSRNENDTAIEMGNSPAMVYNHYRALVMPAAVEEYWKIVPVTGEANNIVAMQAA